MTFNLDLTIFIVFLIANLFIGLWHGKGINTIKEYAVGNKDFSTGAIAATIVATWIAGSSFLTDVSEAYTDGLFYMVPAMLGDLVGSWVIMFYFLAPRMGEFLGSLSIADAMGNLYGNKVRFITAIASAFNCIGKIAAQFKVSATILQLFFHISSVYATLASCIIVVVYSTFGGIRAVTFTDIIQFMTFGAILPIITLIIWGTFTEPDTVFHTLTSNQLFDYHELINHNNPKFWAAFTLTIYFIMPAINPAIFQRISMAKDTEQVSKSFFLAGVIKNVVSILFFWVAILLLTHNDKLDANNLFAYIIDNYTYVGFKGIVAAGVMAMSMSTADSYINAAAVTFAYDVRKSFGITLSEKQTLKLSYVSALLFSLLALVLAFYVQGLFKIILLVGSFYLPVVSTPFLFAVFGFRTSSKSVIIAIFAAVVTVFVWRNYFDYTGINSVIPGVIVNAVFLLSSHYLLKQPGGWVGIKDKESLQRARNRRSQRIKKIVNYFKHFSVDEICTQNKPKKEGIYSLFAFFSIVSVFSTMYTMPYESRQHYGHVIEIIYHSVLIFSAVLLSYPVWPSTFKNEKFISVAWIIGVPYILIFSPTVLVLASHLGQLQLMIFMVNLLIISVLMRWHVSLFMVITGVIFGASFFQLHTNMSEVIIAQIGSIQFKMFYILLLFSSTLIIFFKPKEDEYYLTEAKADHLGHRLDIQERELIESLSVKRDFLRNLEHETHTPITEIAIMGQELYENYDNLTEEQKKESLADIARSSNRLTSLVDNLVNLSKLSTSRHSFNRTYFNLSDLIYTRVDICKKIYAEDREFNFNIPGDIFIYCDKYYIELVLDNLIVNAIQYCSKGSITIELSNDADLGDAILFSIKDTGIGIASEDLMYIFEPFAVSSKTKSKAGGRGIGLALCKKVIEAHGGTIWAESQFGITVFKFTLPNKTNS